MFRKLCELEPQGLESRVSSHQDLDAPAQSRPSRGSGEKRDPQPPNFPLRAERRVGVAGRAAPPLPCAVPAHFPFWVGRSCPRDLSGR